jgi:hypothetical protein
MIARLVSGIAAWAVLGTTALATIRIAGDEGGIIGAYEARYRAIARSGEPVVIDGECTSACTLVLSLPSRQVCATPRARLGVHLAWHPGRRGPINLSQAVTEQALHYPPALRAWIARHGGLATAPKYLAGDDLRQFVRSCA